MTMIKQELEALKESLSRSIGYHSDTAAIHLGHAKDYAYRALIKHATSKDDVARKIENMAIEHAFTHEGLSEGHRRSVHSLVEALKKVEAILDQLRGNPV